MVVDDREPNGDHDTGAPGHPHAADPAGPTGPPDPLRAFLIALLALVIVASISFALATIAKWRIPDDEPDTPSMPRTARTFTDPRRPTSMLPEPRGGSQAVTGGSQAVTGGSRAVTPVRAS